MLTKGKLHESIEFMFTIESLFATISPYLSVKNGESLCGSFTLPNTETRVDTDTDKMRTEFNGNLQYE